MDFVDRGILGCHDPWGTILLIGEGAKGDHRVAFYV